MLSTAWHALDPERSTQLGGAICRPSHANNPLNHWVQASDSNYDWLHRLGVALCASYTARYSRTHAAQAALVRLLHLPPSATPAGPLTPHVQAMPERYKGACAVHAYRLYYVGEKLRFARWRHSEPPGWLDEYMGHLDNLPTEGE